MAEEQHNDFLPITVRSAAKDASPPTVIQAKPSIPSVPSVGDILMRALGERFDVEREIGVGGMGTVLLATDRTLERKVALKVVHPDIAADPHWLDRFRLEATVSAGLQHPNIVQVYEILRVAGQPVLVMEYVDGTSLGHALREGALTEVEAARIVASVCDGLSFAHIRGVIHRDIKPGNILLGIDGVPRIADFGLATQRGRRSSAIIDAAEEGTFLGSPGYVAPEQARGELAAIDSRTDIYALGATLYAVLTGRPPVHGDSFTAVIESVISGNIVAPSKVRPGLNPDLEAVCLKAMATAPAARYGSAAEMARDLRNALAGRPVVARRYGRWETARRAIVFARSAVAMGVASVLLAFCAIAATVVGLHGISKTELFQTMREQVTDLASMGTMIVDPVLVASVAKSPDETSPDARRLEEVVTAIKARSPNLRFVWIMNRSAAGPNILQFLADSQRGEAPPGESSPHSEAPANPGDRYDATRYPELIRGFDEPTADRNYDRRDEWGIALSGYAPIRDGAGNAVAVLGVDMADVDLAAHFSQIDNALFGSLALSATLSLFSVALIVVVAVGRWKRQR